MPGTSSPDVMVSATDLNALHDGDFTLVLGEVHMAINTMRSNCFVTQHPDQADLVSSVDEDFPEPRLLIVLPKENPPELTVRFHPALIRDRDFLVEVTHHTVAADRPGLVLSRDVEVVETEGTVMARLPGGEVFELLDVFAEMLMSMVVNRLQLSADRPHTPRVKIDHLVVSRESWRFNPADLDFAAEKDEAARFVRTREWAAALGIPRYVFVKSSAEEKPAYVDFASPSTSTPWPRWSGGRTQPSGWRTRRSPSSRCCPCTTTCGWLTAKETGTHRKFGSPGSMTGGRTIKCADDYIAKGDGGMTIRKPRSPMCLSRRCFPRGAPRARRRRAAGMTAAVPAGGAAGSSPKVARSSVLAQ